MKKCSPLSRALLPMLGLVGAFQPTLAASCVPNFPYQQGWLGGDSAYSIPLSASRAVWLFGDSFVTAADEDRRQSRMVGNSIAISSCGRDGKWSMEYFWGNKHPSAPRPFFIPQASDKLWPKDGFVLDGKLFLFLDEINIKAGNGPFGFERVGTLLAAISNPNDSPDRWKVKYFTVVRGNTFSPGVSVIKDEEFAYLYTGLDNAKRKHHPLILLALRLDDLRAGSINYLYLAKDGTWRSDYAGHDAKIVVKNGATELSVRYLPSKRSWILVQTEPAFPAAKIIVRFAPSFKGPWAAPKVIFAMPEMQAATQGYDSDTFCYAAKAHVGIGKHSEQLVITYVCNSFKFNKLLSNIAIYRPRVVTCDLLDWACQLF